MTDAPHEPMPLPLDANEREAVAKLAAWVAHEINNPLMSIIGGAEAVISLEGLPERVAEEARLIRREAERCSDITRRLQALSARSVPASGNPEMADAAGSMLAGCRVFVVDDDERVVLVLERILRKAGAEVVSATSGQKAIEALAEADYDIVFTDLSMPDKDGLEVLASLEKRGSAMASRLVFVTGMIESSTARSQLAEMGHPVVTKPFVPEDIHKAARQVLGTP